MVRLSVLSVSALLCLGSACAHTPTSTPVDEAGGTASLEGRMLGRWVTLEWDGARAEGTVSGRPARLSFREEGGALHVQGTVAGRGLQLTLDQASLTGNVDGCEVRLEREQDAFLGRSSCNRALDGEWGLALPEAFERLPRGPRAMLVALAVLDGGYRNTLPPMSPASERTQRRSGGCGPSGT